MIIIAIAWMYVVVLMAATQPTLLAGVLTLFGYGLFPLSIVLYLVGTPGRRKRAAAREAAAQAEKMANATEVVEASDAEQNMPATDQFVRKDQRPPPTSP